MYRDTQGPVKDQGFHNELAWFIHDIEFTLRGGPPTEIIDLMVHNWIPKEWSLFKPSRRKDFKEKIRDIGQEKGIDENVVEDAVAQYALWKLAVHGRMSDL